MCLQELKRDAVQCCFHQMTNMQITGKSLHIEVWVKQLAELEVWRQYDLILITYVFKPVLTVLSRDFCM